MGGLQISDKAAVTVRGTILVVDDSDINRHFLFLLLRKAGYEVVSASNGQQALTVLQVQLPDLVLLDIMMPGVDGYALASMLISEPRTQKIPIIFLSALSDGSDKRKAFELGGADYVTKPFQCEEVLARVAHQLSIARLQRALEREKAELLHANQMLKKAQLQTAQVFSALSTRLVGTVLDGKYRMEVQLGSGGYGVVYRATHLGLEREVAVKVFRPPNSAGADALERFKAEGISACKVSHQNAVAVLDSGITLDGIAYLVMELLRGPTLLDEMRAKKQLSPQRCLEILLPVCDVLIAAHAASIVHRDIKPDNILLHQAPHGELVKVLDFGIAKILGDEPRSAAPVVTEAQAVLGTPTYMSPERLDGLVYDGRADVYSLGVMLYEMLCGEVPFADRHKAPLRVIFNHLTATPLPMSDYRLDLPEKLDALVMQALVKNPLMRPPVQEFREAMLDAVSEARPTIEAELPSPSSRSLRTRQAEPTQVMWPELPKPN